MLTFDFDLNPTNTSNASGCELKMFINIES